MLSSVDFDAQLKHIEQHLKPKDVYPANRMMWVDVPRTIEHYDHAITRHHSARTFKWALWYFALDELIYKADSLACLLSPDPYIRHCKEWFLKNSNFKWYNDFSLQQGLVEHPLRLECLQLLRKNNNESDS